VERRAEPVEIGDAFAGREPAMATIQSETPQDPETPRASHLAADFLHGDVAGIHLADTEEKPVDRDTETDEEGGESCFAGTIPDQTSDC